MPTLYCYLRAIVLVIPGFCVFVCVVIFSWCYGERIIDAYANWIDDYVERDYLRVGLFLLPIWLPVVLGLIHLTAVAICGKEIVK